MFTLNEDLSIYVTRGDAVYFSLTAEDTKTGGNHQFKAGDVVRFKVFGKKDAENVVLQKDFPLIQDAESVDIYLTEEDTKIDEVISKHKDYWYEVELNPFTNPQTIIGYDEDGAKVFRLFPEGDDVPPRAPVKPEDIPIVDDELDMTSIRPVENQAIARAIVSLEAELDKMQKEFAENAAATNAMVADISADVVVERARIDNQVSAATIDGAEVLDIRVGADGVTYGSAGTAVREQIADIGKRIKVNQYEVNDYLNKLGNAVVESGSAFKDVCPIAGVKYNAKSETVIHAYGRNALPFNVVSVVSSVKSNVGDDYVEAELKQGDQFKHFTLAPVFLKAGTYNFGFECYANGENVYTSGINDFGVTYIYKVGDDDTETLVIALSAYDNDCHRLTLQEDAVYVFRPYFVTNKEITEPTTVTIGKVFISETEQTYHAYDGKMVIGAIGDGYLAGFDGINIVSKDPITISYSSFDGVAPSTLVCWGDSLTNGTGSSVAKPSTETNADCSYPAVLGRLLGNDYTVKNFGIGGETSWQIASRQGGMSIAVMPFTLPSDVVATPVTLKGQEQDCFYDNAAQKWTYSKDNLSYKINVGDTSGVNPCKVGGVEGTLTRSGEQYYFTRAVAGNEVTFETPQQLVTFASGAYKDAVHIIWAGQNDAPEHNGKYIMQVGFEDRMKTMVDSIASGKYIVADYPSGTNENSAQRVQACNLKFGKHYLNIRDYIAKYGVVIANSMGAGLSVSEDDAKRMESGQIPLCLLSDSVHGNYWYYQVAARAIREKGLALGYWA